MGTTLARRTAWTLALAAILLTVAGSAQAGFYTWQGTTADWHTAANWNPTSGTPGTGDTAAFTGGGIATVDIGGGATAERINFNLPGGTDYTIQGAGTLTVGFFGSGAIWQRTHSNTIAAQLASAQPLAGTVDGGQLTLSNTANTIGGTWTVNGGTLSAVGSGASSGLGAADVTLNGGTLELAAGAPTPVDGMDARLYDGVASGNIRTEIETNLLSLTPDAQKTLTGHLHFNDDGAFESFFGVEVDDQGDQHSAAWLTDFTPTEDGAWGLRFNHVDDNASIWVDYDQDGVFETAGDLGSEKVYDRGCCAGSGDQYTIALTGGQTYAVAIAMSDTGGGGDFRDMEFKAPSGGWANLDPSANPGLFHIGAFPTADLANNVDVTASSAIQLGTDLPSATLGSLTMAADTQLIVHSVDGGQALEFTGTTTLSGGTATFNTTGGATLTLNNVGETTASNLVKAGDGTLVLPTANTFTGQMTIAAGFVEMGNNASLGTEAGKTVILSGGTLDIAGYRAGASGNELVEVEGTGVGGNGAIINTGGSQTSAFRRITMTGDATFRSDNRWDMRNTGGASTFDMNGHTLTKVGGSDLVLLNTDILDEGSVNVNQGLFRIEGSTRYDGSGTIAVSGGATLDFYNNTQTHSPDIVLQNNSNLTISGGSGTGPTLTGTVTLNGTSDIDTNSKTLTIAGELTGSGGFTKGGGQTLILTNAANSFTGDLAIAAGAVRATSQGALGSPAGEVKVRGATLELDGAWNLDAKPVSLGGGGTLSSMNGDTTVSVPVPVVSDGRFDSATGGATLTINGAIDLFAVGDLTFSGDGDTVVNTPIGNGNAAVTYNDALGHYGYHINNDGLALDLNSNGGMMGGGAPTTFQNLHGVALLTDGPGGRGLDFNDDNDFINTGTIGQTDNYSNLWVATLHVDAANAGNWEFRNAGDDDRAGIWLDLDQDGVFESSTPGLGSNRGEQLSWEDGGTKTKTLAEGDYLIAFTHREGGGGSRADFRFRAMNTMGGQAIIKPADAAQAGLWTTDIDPDNSLIKTGSGTLTLTAANTYNGETIIQAGTLVAAHSSALGTTDGGTIVNNGATLALQGGIAVPAEALTLGTDSGTGTLANLGGANSYAGAVTLGGSAATIDTQAGSLTLGSGIDMGLSNLTVTGPGDTVISGAIAGTSAGDPIITPGLLGGHQPGNPDWGPNSGNLGVVLGPLGGRSGSEHWQDVIGQDNSTLVYNGQIYLDGATTFVESIDDRTRLIIDGTTVLDNGSWNDTTHGTLTRAAGWYDFELRFVNGTGGYGPVKADGWSADFGFGIDVNGNDDEDEAHFVFPLDPGDAALFRLVQATSPSDLIKTGTGTLTLNGNNTYIGITDVQAGTVLVNGATSGQGSYTVHAGATLGGTGTIGLAPGASIDILDDGILAPGTSVGPLSVLGDVMMDGIYAWELSATGGDLVDGAGPDDTLTLNDWIVQLQDAGGDSYGWQKHYLFTGFENVAGPNDWTIDTSQVADWARFSALWDLSIGSDREGIYLTGLATVPEPTTMALLALGALALVRRRRR